MKARIGVAALALGCAILGLRYWPSPEAPPAASVIPTEAPAKASPAPTAEVVVAATVAPSPRHSAPDAEQLLRELEVLSLTDKPLALSRALAGDELLSPQGVMAEARRALIVTLMVDTERMPEARARAREFIRRYPDSRYRPLVQGTTGIHPRPSPSQLRDAR